MKKDKLIKWLGESRNNAVREVNKSEDEIEKTGLIGMVVGFDQLIEKINAGVFD